MNTSKIGIVILMFFTVFASADDVSNMKISYFGNLSIAKVDSAGFNVNYYNNDSVTDEWQLTPFSKAGVQFSYYMNDFTFNAQGLVRDNIDGFDYDLTWFNLKYDFSENYSLRLGRIQTKMFLYSEPLDVDYLHIWAKAPVELYRLMPIRTYEGVEFNYRTNFNEYDFEFSLFGLASYNDEINSNRDKKISIDIDDAFSLAVSLENDTSLYKATYTQSRADIKDDQSLKNIVTALSMQGNDMSKYTFEDRFFKIYSLGYSYNDEIIINSEFTWYDSNGMQASAVAGYVMFGYDFSGFIPYVIYAENRNDKDQYDVSHLQGDATLIDSLGGILYAANYSQKTISIGSRYELGKGIALTAQVDRSTTTNYGNPSELIVQSSGYEKNGGVSRDLNIEDKAIYAFTIGLSFAY